jgi:hypothetical protein
MGVCPQYNSTKRGQNGPKLSGVLKELPGAKIFSFHKITLFHKNVKKVVNENLIVKATSCDD